VEKRSYFSDDVLNGASGETVEHDGDTRATPPLVWSVRQLA